MWPFLFPVLPADAGELRTGDVHSLVKRLRDEDHVFISFEGAIGLTGCSVCFPDDLRKAPVGVVARAIMVGSCDMTDYRMVEHDGFAQIVHVGDAASRVLDAVVTLPSGTRTLGEVVKELEAALERALPANQSARLHVATETARSVVSVPAGLLRTRDLLMALVVEPPDRFLRSLGAGPFTARVAWSLRESDVSLALWVQVVDATTYPRGNTEHWVRGPGVPDGPLARSEFYDLMLTLPGVEMGLAGSEEAWARHLEALAEARDRALLEESGAVDPTCDDE